MSKEYRTFEEWIKECDWANPKVEDEEIAHNNRGCAALAWRQQNINLSATLMEFEALAGKWRVGPVTERDCRHCLAGEMMAAIQSVKKERGLL